MVFKHLFELVVAWGGHSNLARGRSNEVVSKGRGTRHLGIFPLPVQDEPALLSSTPNGKRWRLRSGTLNAVQWMKHGDHPGVRGGYPDRCPRCHLKGGPATYAHIHTASGILHVQPGQWILSEGDKVIIASCAAFTHLFEPVDGSATERRMRDRRVAANDRQYLGPERRQGDRRQRLLQTR